MLHEHHRISVKELMEQLSKLPEDSQVAFLADGKRCQFIGIEPNDILANKDVFIVHLRLLHNYPPVAP